TPKRSVRSPRYPSRRSKARGMRKSLLKTPHSGLNSSQASRPAALVAVGAPRRPAVRRNGNAPYTGVPRVRVAVEEPAYGEEGLRVGRVRLLEGLVSRTEIADCSQLAVQWLAEVHGLRQSICLVRPTGEQSLFVVAVLGFGGSAFTSFAVSLEDWANPLVTAF